MRGDQSGDGGWRPLPPEAAAREAPAPAPFSMEKFGEALARWYGHPLALVGAPLRGWRPAVWVCTARGDAIVYDQALPLPARLRAIAHQLAHMLLNHRGDVDAGEPFPGLAPDIVIDGCPASFTGGEEREADEFADSLLARIARGASGEPPEAR
jgi:hypothetical protein